LFNFFTISRGSENFRNGTSCGGTLFVIGFWILKFSGTKLNINKKEMLDITCPGKALPKS
jgi:hypothetical protein